MSTSVSRVCALAVLALAVLGLASPARAVVSNLQIGVSGLGASDLQEPLSMLLVGAVLTAVGARLRRNA